MGRDPYLVLPCLATLQHRKPGRRISSHMTEDARKTHGWFRTALRPRTNRLMSWRGLPRQIIQPRAICVFRVHLLSSALKYLLHDAANEP
jgi:hypothetical protein